MAFFMSFVNSARELKSLRCLVVTGVLIALDVVLKMTTTIQITNGIKITFAYLALAAIGMLFGPTVGFLSGAVTDIIGFLIRPDGGFNILYTLVEAVGGMMYGIFLYGLKPLGSGNDETGKNTDILNTVIVCLVSGIVLSALSVLGIYSLSLMSGSEGLAGKTANLVSGEYSLIIAGILGFLYGGFFAAIIMLPRVKGRKSTDVRKTARIILSKVSVIIVCNLIMTPAAHILSGYKTLDSTLAGYPFTLIKNAVQCPVDCSLLLLILFPILAAYNRVFPGQGRLSLEKQTAAEE